MREQLTEKEHIDVIFASAGVGNRMEPFGTVTAESFDATFNVNVRGMLFMGQKALAFLRDHRVDHIKRRGAAVEASQR